MTQTQRSSWLEHSRAIGARRAAKERSRFVPETLSIENERLIIDWASAMKLGPYAVPVSEAIATVLRVHL